MATPFFPLKMGLYGDFFRLSRAANSAVSGGIWPNFELLRAVMHVIITCKYEKDRMKNSREIVAKSIFGRSRAGYSVVRGRISPNF